MTAQIHDWWSELTPFEQATIRRDEKAVHDKQQALKKYTEKINREIAMLKSMRQLLVNRGTQRARYGCRPKLTKKDKAITHLESLPFSICGNP